MTKRLKAWGITKTAPQNTIKNPEIQQRIRTLLFQVGLDDLSIYRILSDEGIQIGLRTVQRIRLRLGFRRRKDDPQSQEAEIAQITDVLQSEIGTGRIEGFGRVHLQEHVRRQGYLFSGKRLFNIYRLMRPDSLERRKRDLQRTKGFYTCPGPNFVWHLDGYMKLQVYFYFISS
ncbi:MAG: hypothetical protein ACRD8Z_07550 [Nitrososphaeraceae archaeon]